MSDSDCSLILLDVCVHFISGMDLVIPLESPLSIMISNLDSRRNCSIITINYYPFGNASIMILKPYRIITPESICGKGWGSEEKINEKEELRNTKS